MDESDGENETEGYSSHSDDSEGYDDSQLHYYHNECSDNEDECETKGEKCFVVIFIVC